MRRPLKSIDSEAFPSSWWTPVWEFAVHAVVGTLLFTLVALPAIGLNFFVSWLEKAGASGFIEWGLVACEYLLFVVDILLFVVFIMRQAWKGLVKLW